MKARTMFFGALVFWTTAQIALADDGHEKSFTFGSPGNESEVTRSVDITAADMRFSPDRLEVKQGETIKFTVTNAGKLRHEFAIGDRASQRAHELMMKKMPGMKHGDDPETITLEPGQTKSIVWKFDKRPAAPLEFACHEQGHYEAGMKIAVTWKN